MRRRQALAFVLLVGALVLVLVPGSASGTTRCSDGWTSPSAGGSGTCSWHGGIASDDYSYSPDGKVKEAAGPSIIERVVGYGFWTIILGGALFAGAIKLWESNSLNRTVRMAQAKSTRESGDLLP